MKGRGRWLDNVFIERLWGSVEYEEGYWCKQARLAALRAGLARWLCRYNTWRPHAALGNRRREAVDQAASASLRKAVAAPEVLAA